MTKPSLYSSLTPNSTYYGNHGAIYTTDRWGRVTHVEAEPVPEKAPRNPYAQRTLEGKDGVSFQNAGHIIPASQGGRVRCGGAFRSGRLHRTCPPVLP